MHYTLLYRSFIACIFSFYIVLHRFMLYYTVTTRKLFYDSRPYFIILHYTMSYDIIIIIVIISIIIIIYIYIYRCIYIYIYIYILLPLSKPTSKPLLVLEASFFDSSHSETSCETPSVRNSLHFQIHFLERKHIPYLLQIFIYIGRRCAYTFFHLGRSRYGCPEAYGFRKIAQTPAHDFS